jgi:RNA polymerase-binding transcription factor DksA
MNLTALTLLQGRLLDIAFESGTELQRLRGAFSAEFPRCSDEPEWYEAAQRLQTGLVEFLERRLSTALRALDSIEEGVFGLCERCGRPIDRMQMFADPNRLTCAACAALSSFPLSAPSIPEPSST